MAHLFLFETATFYPLTDDGKNFIPPADLKLPDKLVPSSYIRKEHIANLRALCSGYYGYILGPLYAECDYQMLVTGKTVKKMDRFVEAGVIREVYEETGLYPTRTYKGKHGYDVYIGKCSLPKHVKNPYGDYASMTREEYSDFEFSQRDSNVRINAIIYGQYNEFVEMYKGVDVKRPKFAEENIIGVILIPTLKVVNDLL